jgi:hypothetical protein
MEPSRQQRRMLQTENKQWPLALKLWPREQWPSFTPLENPPIEVWRSRGFMVQVFAAKHGAQRLSVNRTSHNSTSWDAQITWDELQRLKAECGRADQFAVEIFPAERSLINVANMRHLWLLPEPPPFAWITP